MNVAVDEGFRGRGIARGMLERLFELTVGDVERGYTLEVRVSNETAIDLYQRLGFVENGIRRGYYTDNREDALIMWRDPSPRTRDPRARELVRRDGGRGGRRRPAALSVVASQAELHAPYGGVVPEVASRRHLELCVPVIERALSEAGVTLDEIDAIAVTEGPA